jgi:general secretion pathway protein C
MNINLLNYNTLKGYLTRSNIQRATGYLQYALLGLCILLVLLIVRLILNNVLSVGSDIAEYENLTRQKLDQLGAQTVQTDRKRDYSEIAKNAPFGSLQVNNQTTSVNKEEAKPISNLSLELIGTFVTSGQPAHAIILDKKNNAQDVFEINSNIFDAAILVGIFPDRVEINRNGNIEILKLDDTPSSSTDGESSDAELITVSEEEVNSALNNLPLLLTQARAVPYFQDGKSVGLRLFAIKNGSLYEKIGLLNGDILKTINGNNLGDITQAVKLFEQLRDERAISLVLERNRTAKTLQYRIQ